MGLPGQGLREKDGQVNGIIQMTKDVTCIAVLFLKINMDFPQRICHSLLAATVVRLMGIQ